MSEQPDTPTADGQVDLEHWPDALVRAVAAAAPSLLRCGDGYAIRQADRRAWAEGFVREMQLYADQMPFLDLDRYTEARFADGWLEIDADGERWLVATWMAEPLPGPNTREEPEPKRWWEDFDHTAARGLWHAQWSDALLAAVARTAPALLRREDASLALTDDDLRRQALFELLDAGVDDRVMVCFDLDRYVAMLRQRDYTTVEVGGQRWHVLATSSPDEQPLDPNRVGEANEWGCVGLKTWSDALLVACAEQAPAVLRSADRESVFAVADQHLERYVAGAGGHAVCYHDAVPAEVEAEIRAELLSVDVNGERWHVYAVAVSACDDTRR